MEEELEIDIELMYELVMNELIENHPQLNQKPMYWWHRHKWTKYHVTNLTT